MQGIMWHLDKKMWQYFSFAIKEFDRIYQNSIFFYFDSFSKAYIQDQNALSS